MSTLANRTHRRKRVEAGFDRNEFRRVRAEIVRDFFAQHTIAYIDQYHFTVQGTGPDWHIRPDWRLRIHWEHFRREQLKCFSERQVEQALCDLAALGVVEFSRIENQIIIRRTAAGAGEGAYIWAA